MSTKPEYISNEDLDYLDNFLLYRIDEDSVTEGMDEGILCNRGAEGLNSDHLH